MTEIVAVVAVSTGGVIGLDGAMPWKSPRDLRHFRAVTMGHPMIMGRKTFESLPKLLPGRQHIVLTRSKLPPSPQVTYVRSREAALAACAGAPQVMIVGGEEIYRLFYDDLTRIELTLIAIDVEGDAHFSLDPSRDWRLDSEREEVDEALGVRLTFRTYLPDRTKNKYLTASVPRLLRMFGAGEAVPGSGAAAALQALLAAYLALTVIAKSLEKGAGSPRVLRQYAFRLSAGLIPKLRSLFLQDIDVFEQVVALRRRRDEAAGAAKAALSREHTALMQEATRLPDEMFTIAQELAAIGEYLFWNGWQAVRGDSGASVSAAVSAMLACTFIIGVNQRYLPSGTGTDWPAMLTARNRQSLDILERLPTLIVGVPPADPNQMPLPL